MPRWLEDLDLVKSAIFAVYLAAFVALLVMSKPPNQKVGPCSGPGLPCALPGAEAGGECNFTACSRVQRPPCYACVPTAWPSR